MEKQFSQLLVVGPETFQDAVIAAHAAIGAIFTAEIGNLNHGPHEDVAPELRPGGGERGFMQCGLGHAVSSQVCLRWEILLYRHEAI